MQEEIEQHASNQSKLDQEVANLKRQRQEMLAFQSDEVSKAILDSHVYKDKVEKLKDEVSQLKFKNKELERYQCLYNQLKENEDKRQKDLLWAKAE